jgi:hypothetical protein
MVEDKERLASKLQPELIQWGPFDKLIRRDEELQFIVDEGSSIEKYLKAEEAFGYEQISIVEE